MKINLKSLFFETDSTETTSKPEASQVQAVSEPVPVTPITFVSNTSSDGISDPKFIEFFNNLLTEANIPGPDYYEFKKNLENTASIGASVPEATRYMMVYSMMLSGGLTKQHLIDTAQKYLVFLDQKHQDALKDFDDKHNTEVGSRQNKLAQLVAANEADAKQMSDLTLAIQKRQEEQSSLKGDIATVEAKLDQKKKNYIASYNGFKGSIEEDITKIQTNIN